MRIASVLLVALFLLMGAILGPTACRPQPLGAITAKSVRIKSLPIRRSGGGGYYRSGSSGSRYSSGGGFSSGK